MSWTDKELDKLFKSAADAQKVTYQDSYWDEMNALLGEEKKRKGAFLWWLTGAGVMIGLIVTAVFMFTSKGVNNQQIAIQTATTETLSNENSAQESVSKEQSTNTTTEGALVKDVPQLKTNTEKQSQSYSSQKSTNQVDMNTVKKDLSGEEVASSTTLKENENNEVATNAISAQEANSDLINDETLTRGDFGNQIEPSNIVSSVEPQTDQIELDALDERTDFNMATQYLYDQVNPIDYLFAPRRKVGFYTELNGGLSQSYLITNEHNWGYAANFSAGIEYYQKAWQFAGGIGMRFEHYSNIVRHYERNSYSYGLVQEAQDNAYDQFLRLEAPFSMAYALKKFEIRAGITPSFLIGTRKENNLNNSNSIAFNTFESNNETTSEFVRSEYFKPFGLQSQFGIGYAILPKLTLNLNTRIHLINPIQVDHFIGEYKSLPMTLEIGLRKRF